MIQRFFLLAAFAVSLSAAPFTGMVVFGDSLSDTGRLFAATGGTFPPDPPYFQGRGSNGPLAVEYLSDLLGIPILDNFAFYGATTGLGNVVDGGTPAVSNGLPGVLKTYSDALIGGLSINPTDLYIILGGPANDFRNGDFSPTALLTAVSNQIALVTMLQAQGAQNIVIAGVPDLGLLPFVAQQGPAVALGASLFSQSYNDALRAALPQGARFFDLSAVLYAAIADPSFTNETDPCVVGVVVCANPDEYIFWDNFHPTTRVHELAAERLAATIPEPGVLVTVASGFGVLLVLRRRMSNAA